MKLNEYTLERIALYIGWHQSMLIKQYPSHTNINAGLSFLRSNFHSRQDQLIKVGLFESLHDHVGASSAIVNEYSARGLLIKYDQDLYDGLVLPVSLPANNLYIVKTSTANSSVSRKIIVR